MRRVAWCGSSCFSCCALPLPLHCGPAPALLLQQPLHALLLTAPQASLTFGPSFALHCYPGKVDNKKQQPVGEPLPLALPACLWFSRHLQVAAVMRPLQLELRELVERCHCPNRFHPSDHLPIGAVLHWGRAHSAAGETVVGEAAAEE